MSRLKQVLGLAVVALLACGPGAMTGQAAAPAGVAKGWTQKYRIVVVVNDLSGTHTVRCGSAVRTLSGKGAKAVFFLPTGGWPMFQLDGGYSSFYQLGYSTVPDVNVIYTSWMNTGPM